MSQSFRDASTCSEVDGTSVRRKSHRGQIPDNSDWLGVVVWLPPGIRTPIR